MTTDTSGGVAGGATVSESPPSKQNLISWWKQFSKRAVKVNDKEVLPKGSTRAQISLLSVKVESLTFYPHSTDKPGIFGVPLGKSIEYANVAISLTDPNGNSFIYGYVPIVVAKCGVFLKEKGMCRSAEYKLYNNLFKLTPSIRSYGCRGNISSQWFRKANKRPTEYLQHAGKVWKGFRLEWLYGA